MNAKLILLIILLLNIIALVISMVANKRSEAAPKVKYAQLLLPNGNYVQGRCERIRHFPYGCVKISIEGIRYRTHISRLVIWEYNS